MYRGLYFGKELKELRKKNGLSQQEVADTYQYDRTTISLFEHNKMQTPDELIIKLAIDLGDRETLGEFIKEKGLEIIDTIQETLSKKLTQMIQIFDQEKPLLLI